VRYSFLSDVIEEIRLVEAGSQPTERVISGESWIDELIMVALI